MLRISLTAGKVSSPLLINLHTYPMQFFSSMKRTCRTLVFALLPVILLTVGCDALRRDMITFPYSQWTAGTNGHHIYWSFGEDIEHNNAFIKTPEEGAWEEWYRDLLEYRELVRSNIGRVVPRLTAHLPAEPSPVIHFDQFAYQLDLRPGEKIEITGRSLSTDIDYRLHLDFDLKYRGEETGYIVRRRILSYDTLHVNAERDWTGFTLSSEVPEFSSDSFSIVPLLRLQSADQPIFRDSSKVEIDQLRLHVESNSRRKELLDRIGLYLQRHSGDNVLELSPDVFWNNQNFVMGFVFAWDHTFWDHRRTEYLVERYCETMEREFGGIQSVILWTSYPNLGIDQRNQFDFMRAMPWGMEGLKTVADEFHLRDVKVFLTYNPWDLDTRRTEQPEFREFAGIVGQSGADGIFLDTWRSAKGVISVFEQEESLRDEVAKAWMPVALTAEITPELKDLYGPDALTGSWGQEGYPYHFTDLSLHKWLMPTFKQYYVRRGEEDRKQILAHAWINGQGIQIWENIFGTMNLWEVDDRKSLRKMNAIWKVLGPLYLRDSWKPFLPTGNPGVVASQWESDNQMITNFVHTEEGATTVSFPVTGEPGYLFFDLWNGRELQVSGEGENSFIEMELTDFACLLRVRNLTRQVEELLGQQEAETLEPLPEDDLYTLEASLELPFEYPYRRNPGTVLNTEMLFVTGGTDTLSCSHIWREGQCYPDVGARDNDDLNIEYRDGVPHIVHTHTGEFPGFAIMPAVVTNRQFEEFLDSTGYSPRSPENFLLHWGGNACPPEILDDPVVYVSLDDARAFAIWAGMRLPSEWEWQLAAEQHGERFRFNEVFE